MDPEFCVQMRAVQCTSVLGSAMAIDRARPAKRKWSLLAVADAKKDDGAAAEQSTNDGGCNHHAVHNKDRA